MANGLLLAIIGPLGILAHELGHALVALRVTSGPVRVLVGRQPGLLKARVGRLSLSIHLEPARGTGWAGVCLFKLTHRPRDTVMIVAAGPIASLLWAIACAAAFVIWGHRLDPVGVLALALGVVQGTVSFVYNSAAAVMPSLRTARPRSDGAKLQKALRAHQALRKVERKLGRPIARHELHHLLTTKRLPPDARRALTSVAPPHSQAPRNRATSPSSDRENVAGEVV